MLALQRSAGNAAVARMLASEAGGSVGHEVEEIRSDPEMEEELAADLGIEGPGEEIEGGPASVPIIRIPEPADREGEREGPVLHRQSDPRRRQGGRGATQAQPSQRIGYFTVGDPQLNYGNAVFMRNLEELPRHLQRFRGTPGWTMVLSIHGAEDIVSGQGGRVSRRSGNVYDAGRVSAILSDPAFIAWRNANGPSHLVMNACQLNASFEQVFINGLVRPGPGGRTPGAQGLGTDCRPRTTLQRVTVGGRNVTSREQFARLHPDDQQGMIADLQQLNREWGYFGRPPVPDGEVLRYYLDEPVRGAWVVVEVGVDHQGTGIPFYNRSRNTRFNQMCTRGLASLPSRL